METTKSESQSSLELGYAGRRFKFYFWSIEELKDQVKEAVTALKEEAELFEFLEKKEGK